MKRRCPKCAAEWAIKGPIGFREECPQCAAFMHTCAHCRNYESGTKSCRLPDTESVRDRESVNFCEEFEFGPPDSAAPGPPLAGKPPAGDARQRFEDLFRDKRA